MKMAGQPPVRHAEHGRRIGGGSAGQIRGHQPPPRIRGGTEAQPFRSGICNCTRFEGGRVKSAVSPAKCAFALRTRRRTMDLPPFPASARPLSIFRIEGPRHVASSLAGAARGPTLLFTNAGMNQFKDLLSRQGEAQLRSRRDLAALRARGATQRFRENVGYTARHRFSRCWATSALAIISKRDAIQYAWELLTVRLQAAQGKTAGHRVRRGDDDGCHIWANEIGVVERASCASATTRAPSTPPTTSG